MLRNINWLWLGVGALAGWFAIPKILPMLGINLGLTPAAFDPWQGNYGTSRPLGVYGMGQLYHGAWRPGTMLGPIMQYRGQKMGDTDWTGRTGELGQAWGSGKDILPFGLPYEYR